ncbi:MAG: metallophosphoesterase family protein [Flammeovirgaceae bacterium]|nr:MAG: metallophosphoesterase family protein [Flammeovirgaceae bacterium]
MKIGVLSDTHGYLDPQVIPHFNRCDEIWHAGDIGNLEVTQTLQAICPIRAVSGNIDDRTISTVFPDSQRFTVEGLEVWMTHIGGTPPYYNSEVRTHLQANAPDIFICGHSHMLKIMRDPKLNNMLFINPGAAGNHGFHTIKTIVRFDVKAKQITNMEVIELGKRGAL